MPRNLDVPLRAWRTLLLWPVLALIVGGAPAPAVESPAVLDNALVEVLVTAQELDPFLPWQKRPPRQRDGFGVAVGPRLVLTTERLVRNHTLVELRRPRTGEKLAATVVLADMEIDLALLRVAEEIPAFAPLRFDTVPLRATEPALSVTQLDDTGQPQTGGATVLKIAAEELPSAPFPALLATLVTDIAITDEGAPVLRGEVLAGLVVDAEAGPRTATMLPAAVLGRFVNDAGAPAYAGFPMAGFLWEPLVDPVKRRYFGLEQMDTGILVLAALPGTGAAEVFEPNDVILSWDSTPIDALGYYQDAELGRLQYSNLIKFRRQVGERVPVSIVRDQVQTNVTVRLARFDDQSALIPENLGGAAEPYLIEGGFIFRELTGNYLKARGGDWMRQVDPRLAQLYHTRRFDPATPGERVVILSGVLPDTINVDYTDLRDEVVTAINGEPVPSLAALFDRLGATGCVTRVRLQGIDLDIALDPDSLSDANARIQKHYRIPERRRLPAPAAAVAHPGETSP